MAVPDAEEKMDKHAGLLHASTVAHPVLSEAHQSRFDAKFAGRGPPCLERKLLRQETGIRLFCESACSHVDVSGGVNSPMTGTFECRTWAE